jgi:hypothetical protein
MKSGWFRLWVVLSSAILLCVVSASAYYVWVEDACYTLVTVSVADSAAQEDRQLAESVRDEATEKTFCGSTQYSPILTLEGLAERGAVTQVGLSWQEPHGWSFKDHDMLDVLDKGEITTAEIIGRVQRYVQEARLKYAIWFAVAAAAVSFMTLILGVAVAWVRRGFQGAGA